MLKPSRVFPFVLACRYAAVLLLMSCGGSSRCTTQSTHAKVQHSKEDPKQAKDSTSSSSNAVAFDFRKVDWDALDCSGDDILAQTLRVHASQIDSQVPAAQVRCEAIDDVNLALFEGRVALHTLSFYRQDASSTTGRRMIRQFLDLVFTYHQGRIAVMPAPLEGEATLHKLGEDDFVILTEDCQDCGCDSRHEHFKRRDGVFVYDPKRSKQVGEMPECDEP